MSLRSAWAKLARPYLGKKRKKKKQRAGVVAQVVEGLPSKVALGSILSTTHKKEKNTASRDRRTHL
jgi:hypothetical protein